MNDSTDDDRGPDCRLCKRYAGWGKPCRATEPCVEGNQFIKDYPVRMWLTREEAAVVKSE